MTTQDVHNKVEAFKQLTEFIKEQNPEIDEIAWKIKDVSYSVFNEYRQHLNEGRGYYREEISLGNRLYCFVAHAHANNGCGITLWTVPLKLKTTVEVLEEELEPA